MNKNQDPSILVAITFSALSGREDRTVPEPVSSRPEALSLLKAIRGLSKTALVGLLSDCADAITEHYTTVINRESFTTGWLWPICAPARRPNIMAGATMLLNVNKRTQLDIAIATPGAPAEMLQLAKLGILLGKPPKKCEAGIAIWPDGLGMHRQVDYPQQLYHIQDLAQDTTTRLFAGELESYFEQRLSESLSDLPTYTNQ